MLTHSVTFLWRNPGNWKKLVKKFANMNHSIEQDLGAQGWSLQPYSSSTDAYSLCLDPVAPRLAFLKINPRATTSQMSVSPSISTLTLTSPSDSSLQITIIPVENVKKTDKGWHFRDGTFQEEKGPWSTSWKSALLQRIKRVFVENGEETIMSFFPDRMYRQGHIPSRTQNLADYVHSASGKRFSKTLQENSPT